MGDFLELGISGADKLIDKHFEKIPDKYVHKSTYNPKNLAHPRKGSKDHDQESHSNNQRDSTPRGSRQRDEQYYDDRDDYRRAPYPHSDTGMPLDDGRPRDGGNSSPYFQDGPFVTPPLPQYSQLPPHQRPEYIPDQSPVDPYYAPPDRRRTYDDDEYYSSSHRPAPVHRRSSSYHGPRRHDDFYSSDEEKQLAVVDRGHKHHRSGSHADFGDRVKDSARRYGLKEEITSQFSKSKEGLAGGAIGAAIGGWAAHKALESRGKSGKGKEDALLTLLGAAVGGLAANVVVDKWEDHRLEEAAKDDKWEDKWGGRDKRGRDDEYDDRRSEGRSRRDDRRGRDRYSDDGYYR